VVPALAFSARRSPTTALAPALEFEGARLELIERALVLEEDRSR
jgi:hypothetical protein